MAYFSKASFFFRRRQR